MKSYILLLLITVMLSADLTAQNLPNEIYSGKQGAMHVQGMVVDKANACVYFSFTDKLVKTDLSGKLIGSVTGFVGHLGDLDITEDGKIYGSLEYKNDAIGKRIKRELGVKTTNEDSFYIAIFDGSLIVRPNMDAEKEDLLRTVYIKEAVDDYTSHRFGCSGIDGVTFAPAIGEPKTAKKYLYVAYGIYGDTARNDNDHQIILKYDIADWKKYAQHLSQGKLHHSGPTKPLEKYFVKTGNTRYGIQNLAYDNFTGNLFAAVYQGEKPQFPNYDLFVIDGKKKPISSNISISSNTSNQSLTIKQLSLLETDKKESNSGIGGWFFKWGATGLCPIGDGFFYISHNEKTKDGQQQTTLYKYKWVGKPNEAFVLVK